MVKRRWNIIILIVGVLGMCCLWGCKSFRQEELSKTEEQLAILEEKAAVIMQAFEQEDITLLNGILSNDCKSQLDLIDGFSYSCQLLDTEMLTIERSGCPILGYFEYWYDNDFDSNKLGVRRIKLYDPDVVSSTPDFVPGRLYDRSGIYCPAWDE